MDAVGVLDFATGTDGVATLLGIPEGAYRLVEENNPGFGRVEPVEFTVTGENTQETPTVIGVENQPLALEITKVDAQSLEPLSGVPFKLSDSKGNLLKFTQQPDGAYHLDENGADTIVSNAEGKILVRYIPMGTVILSEEEYLGYSIGEPVEIEIGNENTIANPCKVTVENQPIALEITKTDLLTRKPMAGVVFEILDKEGKTLAFTRQENGVWQPAKESETGITQLTSDNADENGIARDRYTVVAGNVLDDNGFVDSLGTGYDIVVANIVAGVIVPLTDIVPRLLKKGGLYITSGIIAECAQEVIDAMQRNGFTVTYTENRKDWMVIVATR